MAGVIQNKKLMGCLITSVMIVLIFCYEAATNKRVSDELSRDFIQLERTFESHHSVEAATSSAPQQHGIEHVQNFAATLLLAFAAGAVSAAGGIGGGGVLVPLYILVAPMTPHGAIPLSKVTIFGNALCQLMLNFPKKHPQRSHRPLIDYDVALMMEPRKLEKEDLEFQQVKCVLLLVRTRKRREPRVCSDRQR
eukprot:SAG31_NODE_18_length_35375_cov_22.525315_30_plen_194_part_00